MLKKYRVKFFAIVLSVSFLGQAPLWAESQLPTSRMQGPDDFYSVNDLSQRNAAAENLVNQKNEASAFPQASEIPSPPKDLVVKEYFYLTGIIKKREYRDAQNKLVQVWNYSTRGDLYTISYRETARGRQTRLDSYDTLGNLIQRDDYDVLSNHLVKTTTYLDNGIVASETSYSAQTGLETGYKVYDFDGNLNEMDTFNSKGKKSTSAIYYPNGIVNFFNQFNATGSIAILTITYDSDGKITRQEEFTKTGVRAKIIVFRNEIPMDVYFFSATGKLVSGEAYRSNGNLYSRDTYASDESTKTKTEYFSARGVIRQKIEFNPTANVATRQTDYDTDGQAVSLTEYDAQNTVIRFVDYAHVDPAESAAVYGGLTALQTAQGLVPSHPDDTSFIYQDGVVSESAKIFASDQAYIYDQAVFGIAMLKSGDLAAAKKVFDFFYVKYQTEENFSGFWTVYDKNDGSKKYEYRKGMGENAWIALFALQYANANASVDFAEKDKGLDLAKGIAHWLTSLPHAGGGVAMGPDVPGDLNYGKIYSTENMLDYYALLTGLTSQLPAGQEKTALFAELNSLKNFLKTQAYDRASGLFKRGGTLDPVTGKINWDTVAALDVNSWAIQAIGIPALVKDFGINIANFITKIENTFAVQTNGSYGGNILTAKGFDFSDSANKTAITTAGGTRPALRWVEGTYGMIVSYWKLAQYFRLTGKSSKAVLYENRAKSFTTQLRDPLLRTVAANGTISYTSASAGEVQIYRDMPGLKTSPGTGAASSAWAILALVKFNPFIV